MKSTVNIKPRQHRPKDAKSLTRTAMETLFRSALTICMIYSPVEYLQIRDFIHRPNTQK